MTRCICSAYEFDGIGIKHGKLVGRCLQCGLVRTIDLPGDYSALYTEGDRYHGEREGQVPYRDRFDHDYVIAQLRLPKIVQHFRLLDVGCANGAFVAYASDLGFDAEGLEINSGMAEWARNQTGRPIHTTWDTVRGCFDVVTLHDVIEHFEDPVGELLEIANYVARDGILVVDTPDADDSRFAELGMDWHHMKPLEHLWFFTADHLKKVLEMANFVTLDVDKPIQGKIVAYCRRN